MSDHKMEIESGERFGFGQNWQAFLRKLDENIIRKAEQSLRQGLELDSLEGKKFLDAGSGSGLFSLAAKRLGADVVSFDYDPQSVACTRELKSRYFPDDGAWTVMEGSVLDQAFLAQLGDFDVVYSWGVLHHTGSMWQAIDNVTRLVKPGGKFFTAIYNDAGRKSRYWWHIKRLYVKHPALRKLLIFYAFLTTRSGWIARGLLKADPLYKFNEYANENRGMSPWYDLIDWVGGYPYEYASPEEIFESLKKKGFSLTWLSTMGGGTGCNQFVFLRNSGDPK